MSGIRSVSLILVIFILGLLLVRLFGSIIRGEWNSVHHILKFGLLVVALAAMMEFGLSYTGILNGLVF